MSADITAKLAAVDSFLVKLDRYRLPISSWRVLTLLAHNPKEGKTRTEILNAIERSQNTSNANYLLKRLTGAQLVEERRTGKRQRGSLPRYFYHITPEGLHALGLGKQAIHALLS